MIEERWDSGYVRWLRLDDRCPVDEVTATPDHGIIYTLNVHPRHAGRVEEYRKLVEAKLTGYWKAVA